MNLDREYLARQSLIVKKQLEEKEFRELKDIFQYHPNMTLIEQAVTDAVNRGQFEVAIPANTLKDIHQFRKYLSSITNLSIDECYGVKHNYMNLSWYPKGSPEQENI